MVMVIYPYHYSYGLSKSIVYGGVEVDLKVALEFKSENVYF